MDNGSKRSGPPEDSSSSRAKQLFGPPIYPDAKRRIMMKCIAAVLIVLGMFMTAGVTPYSPRARVPIHEPNRVSWAEFRKDPRHRKAFRRTSAKKCLHTLWYLVPGTRYCCVCFCISRRKPFFAAKYSYGIFLTAELGTSPNYSISLISVCKA